ncbi:MAG TPA: YceI family protein [Gemmatimonadales bacterium]|nr:YceI family protein [Gemmatimonadales bacterium]
MPVRFVPAALLAPVLAPVLALAAAAAPLAAQGSPATSTTSAGATTAAPVTGVRTFAIDRAHSEITFRIRHMMSRVSGTFGEWTGTITADPAQLAAGAVNVDIKTASIDTRQPRRDTHLRSADFFAADSFPAITFRSRQVRVQGDSLHILGDLTIRGITKPVTLDGEFLGADGQPGKRRIGFAARTRINRLDYGVKWNRGLEAGGVVLGDDVDIEVNVEAVEQ